MPIIRLRTGAWFDEKIQEFELPPEFEVYNFAPANAKPLATEEVRHRLEQPFGPTLDELVSGKRTVTFVVDDLGRPTPAYTIIPFVLNIIRRHSIKDSDIRFIIATGSHRQLNRYEFELKLGKSVVDNFHVENHDAFNSPVVRLGYGPNGFPIVVNRTIAESDLLIGIGCIIPHSCHGFGGGAKLFCPGVAGMESIVAMHGFTSKRGRARESGSCWDMRKASEAFASFLPPIFLINTVLSTEREICDVFAGEYRRVFEEGQKRAAEVYATLIPRDIAKNIDVVLANFYPLDSDPVQSGKSPWIPKTFPNALIIQVNSTADGIDYHGWKLLRRSHWITLMLLILGEGLSLRFMPSFFQKLPAFPPIRALRSVLIRWMVRRSGVDYAQFIARQRLQTQRSKQDANVVPSLTNRPWIFSKNYPMDQFRKKYPRGVLLRTWNDVLRAIERHFPHPKIAVIPSAPVQIPQFEEQNASHH